MNKRILSLLICTLSATAHAKPLFTPPKLADNANTSAFAETKDGSRNEAWVNSDFMVGLDGKPMHVLLESEDPRYFGRTKLYLQQLNYAVASLNGEKIASSSQFYLRHYKTFTRHSNNNVSTTYTKNFDQTKQLIAGNKLSEAKPALAELTEKYTKNIAEQAYTAWLSSAYFYNIQDWHNYELQLRKATDMHSFLEPDLALMSMQSLMNLELYNQQYGNALQTLLKMRHIKNKQLSKQTVTEFKAQLHEQLAAQPVNTVTSKLVQSRTWRHILNRSTISLSAENGNPSAVALYCQNGYQRFSELPVNNYQVPDSYGRCYLAVQGETDTQITYREEGKVRLGLNL
ncbi:MULTISPECIES: hypothetical protein [unclassified Pseudoalteromonas]|uniref:hypothetical protein n=1 Tax=unclassified Pseudoalteromonas TaxID=194690 RepID=UPI0020970037|nr:hypothetical protein [Pseudoalteromonas sp. XMcav2-N]MCO7189395.1 hypothetical protein [Pseudoalteromonas sp. XMcav2-N]